MLCFSLIYFYCSNANFHCKQKQTKHKNQNQSVDFIEKAYRDRKVIVFILFFFSRFKRLWTKLLNSLCRSWFSMSFRRPQRLGIRLKEPPLTTSFTSWRFAQLPKKSWMIKRKPPQAPKLTGDHAMFLQWHNNDYTQLNAVELYIGTSEG